MIQTPIGMPSPSTTPEQPIAAPERPTSPSPPRQVRRSARLGRSKLADTSTRCQRAVGAKRMAGSGHRSAGGSTPKHRR